MFKTVRRLLRRLLPHKWRLKRIRRELSELAAAEEGVTERKIELARQGTWPDDPIEREQLEYLIYQLDKKD